MSPSGSLERPLRPKSKALATGAGVALGLAALDAWLAHKTLGMLTAGLQHHVAPRLADVLADADLKRTWWMLQLLYGIGWGTVAYCFWPKPKASPGDAWGYGSHGTARWATPEELVAWFRDLEAQGLVLGTQQGRYQVHPLDSHLTQITTVLGGPGSMKSRAFAIPNILHERTASLLITDPKGELYRATAAAKRRDGYELRVINLKDRTASDRYNPLSYVRDTQDALRLAANIVANTNTGDKGAPSDPLWPNAEKALLAAVALYVMNHRPQVERHMASVLALVTTLARDQEAMDRVFDALPAHSPALRMYDVFRLAQDKTRAGILIGLAVRLQLWATREIATLTAGNDFDLADPGRHKMAVYLIIPDDEDTYTPLTALFWTQAIQELYRLADANGGRVPQPVRLLLEEFCNLGQITDYPKKVSTCRGRGIWPIHVIQEKGQLTARYGDHGAAEILGACDTLVFLGTNDLATANYISDRLGMTTVKVKNTSHQDGRQGGSNGESDSYTGRKLLHPDEVMQQWDALDTMVFQRSRRPVCLRKADYLEYPGAREVPRSEPAAYTPAATSRPLVITDVAALVAACTPPPEAAPAPADPAPQNEAPPGRKFRAVRPPTTSDTTKRQAAATNEED